MKNNNFDTKLFAECCSDMYYLKRLNCDAQLSINVLKSVYSSFYVNQAAKLIFCFSTIMRATNEIPSTISLF